MSRSFVTSIAEGDRQNEHDDAGQAAGEQQQNGFFQVSVDDATLFNRGRYGGEVVIRDDDVRGLLGDVSARQPRPVGRGAAQVRGAQRASCTGGGVSAEPF
jgi:hypothetical protein